MQPSPPAVEFSGVSRNYGKVLAVDRVSLSVRDGEFFSMLGPSGSGKTTCLRLISGFEQPSCGSVGLHGEGPAGVAEALSWAEGVIGKADGDGD